jgi:hypothetical protein
LGFCVRRAVTVSELEFSAEQRACLGLEPGQRVRVLASSPRTIVLERMGAAPATAYPWDRDLVLSADVRAFPIADLLHMIHASAKSGFLCFENGEHAKSVYLHRGEVVFAASNQTVDRLGETLLRAGLLTAEQFREARQSFHPSTRYGKMLVERGLLAPRQVWNGVKLQVEEIVRSLFSYSAGTVLFFEGEVRPDNVVRLSLPTRRLVAEGLRRRDQLLRFLSLLECRAVRLRGLPPGASLSGGERAFHEALVQESSFADACRRVGVDPLTGARLVQLLRLLGAVAIERADGPGASAAEGSAGQAEADALRECVELHLRLLGELAAPIVAIEGPEALRTRLAQVAEEAARRFPMLLGDVEVGPGGSLDPEALVARALRFPGDRVREVQGALGELVSYLEFDLLNHPRIDEPEAFLEGLEELRARL